MIDNHDHLRSTSSQVGYQLPGKAYTHQVSSRSNVYGRHHTYLLTIHGLIGGVTVGSGLNRRRDRQQETARNMYIWAGRYQVSIKLYAHPGVRVLKCTPSIRVLIRSKLWLYITGFHLPAVYCCVSTKQLPFYLNQMTFQLNLSLIRFLFNDLDQSRSRSRSIFFRFVSVVFIDICTSEASAWRLPAMPCSHKTTLYMVLLNYRDVVYSTA